MPRSFGKGVCPLPAANLGVELLAVFAPDSVLDCPLRYGASVKQDTSSGVEANNWRVERLECWRELPWSSGSWRLVSKSHYRRGSAQ